jgi:hypothetical protein
MIGESYCLDPSGINCGEEHYQDEFCSRDFERTPMQWDETANAGKKKYDIFQCFMEIAKSFFLPRKFANYPTKFQHYRIRDIGHPGKEEKETNGKKIASNLT